MKERCVINPFFYLDLGDGKPLLSTFGVPLNPATSFAVDVFPSLDLGSLDAFGEKNSICQIKRKTLIVKGSP